MLKLKNKYETYKITSDHLTIEILKSGDIFRIYQGDIQINLFKGNLLDGAINNIYLRKKQQDKYEFEKLIGVKSNAKFLIKDNKVIYEGSALNVNYQVSLTLIDDTWYYYIHLDKTNSEAEFDLIYVQDIGVAPTGMLQSSEAYTGQYVDKQVFEENNNISILFRQNQGVPNLVQIGSFNEIDSYATDGFQFYGLDYKINDFPSSLREESLPSKNYQYEFPLATLQTTSFKLEEEKSFTFYGKYINNHKEIETKPFDVNKVSFKKEELDSNLFTKLTTNIKIGSPIVGNDIDEKSLLSKYNNVRQIEKDNNKLLSFFANNSSHIVTKAKELIVERPHGQVLIQGDMLNASENVMASTGHMYGVFSSHIVLGNTNFHKLTGDVRNKLNIQKIAGQRIYLLLHDTLHLLTMPSYFEINPNNLKWIYELDHDTFEINYKTDINSTNQQLSFESKNNYKYNLVITNQIVLGERESDHEITFNKSNNKIEFTFDKNPMVMDKYPTLKYQFESLEDVEILDDQFIFGNSAETGLLIFKYNEVNNFHLNLYATYDKEYNKNTNFDIVEINKSSYTFFRNLTKLQIDSKDERINSFNDLSVWYTQNALVHYSSPHGLEQFNGAAWGTRDVMQGPFELFLVTQRHEYNRTILLRTFARQFLENGDFPQWFMFDKYFTIQPHDSHADIIVWPIKALANYLEVTNDFSILEEKAPYMSLSLNNFTEEKYSIVDHVNKALDRIKSTTIKDTNLPKYGGGDWNDTLQPANQELTERMVSAWTVSLLHEALTKLSAILPNKYQQLKNKIIDFNDKLKADYLKYLVKDNIPTGFTIFEEKTIRYLLHPSDTTTNLNYRLLSFNQGLTSELLSTEQIPNYLNILDKNLKHPDGMRLMDKAIKYQGGKTTYFQRAETAANFGREVGIHYIHAHIRYIEAMAKIGYGSRALEGLLVINPINIKNNVKNALPRQSNTYFSSSDGDFLNRYDAQENFDKLRNGSIGVKAGWRLYSSGPGIYLNQLVSNVLGIKIYDQNLIIDPVLSEEFNNTVVKYHYLNKPLEIKYIKSNENKLLLNGKEYKNARLSEKYRDGGLIIDKEILKPLDKIKIEYHF